MRDNGREICVLAVDDDEGTRLLLSVELAEWGCRVLTAPDGVEATEILKAEAVDLLITDFAMPRMNGLELIQWTKAWLPHVGVVLLTGDNDPALAAAARGCGALRVYLKPFPIEELLSLVEDFHRTMPIRQPAASPSSARA